MMNSAEVRIDSGPNPWKVAILCCMACYLDAGAITSISTALVLYAKDFRLTAQDIGTMSGMLTALFAIGALLGGFLGDRYGRRRVFRVSLTLFMVGCALFAGATERWMLYVSVCCVGFSVGADIPVSLAMLSEVAPDALRGRMVSLSNVFWVGGIVATAILTTLLAKHGVWGGRIMLGQLGIVAAVVLICRSGIPESKMWLQARTSAPRRDALACWREVGKPPVLGSTLALGLFFTFTNLPANTMGQFGALIFKDLLHIPLETFATFGLASLAWSTVLLACFIRVVDGPHRSRWIRAGVIAAVVAAVIPVVFGARLETLIVSMVFGTFGGVFAGESVYRIYSQELVPTMLRGTTQGLTTSLGRFIAAAFAIATPSLLTHGTDALFSTLMGFTLVAALILWLWLPRRPRLGFEEPTTGVVQEDDQVSAQIRRAASASGAGALP